MLRKRHPQYLAASFLERIRLALAALQDATEMPGVIYLQGNRMEMKAT